MTKRRKLTVEEYMVENNIKSKTTVYNQIKHKVIEAEDLNKGKTARAMWRIIVEDDEIQAAA